MQLSPEAILVLDSVRRLEQMTDIGPGRVGRLLIAANFAEAKHRCGLLREAGWLIDLCWCGGRTYRDDRLGLQCLENIHHQVTYRL